MRQRLKTHAIVLKREAFGESDRIVTLFTKSHGKLRVIAKGARRSKRRFGGCLELFSWIKICLVDKGMGRLAWLEEAILVEPHEFIKSNLVSIAQASYLVELSGALLAEGDPAEDIYDLLLDQLAQLKQGPLQSLQLRFFEFNILTFAGLAPRLDSCLDCKAQTANVWIFDHVRGGVLCQSCTQQSNSKGFSTQTLEFLQSLQINKVYSKPVNSESMDVARRLLASIIDNHIGYSLKAREFLHEIACSPPKVSNPET